MKNVSDVWTLVYKEKDSDPLAFTYDSEKEATLAKIMLDDADGGEMIDDNGNFTGIFEIEWSYLINGKLIQTS